MKIETSVAGKRMEAFLFFVIILLLKWLQTKESGFKCAHTQKMRLKLVLKMAER